MGIKELKEKRVNLYTQAQEIIDRADAEKREMTAEETGQVDALFNDMEKIVAEVETREKADAVRKALEAPGVPQAGNRDLPGQGETASGEQAMAAFRSFLVGGPQALRGEELRALQADSDIYGGYITAPPQFVNQLIAAVDNLVFMRGLATTHTINGTDSLGAPSLDNDPAAPTWTAEVPASISEDSTMSFGRRELKTHQLAKLVKISQKLLRVSSQPAEQLVIDRLAYKFAITFENAYLNGDGSGQPLGIFTATDDGIGTARDVSTGNTATEIKGDGLINAKYALKAQYRNKAKWLFHRDAVKMIMTLKDGEGRYMWQPSIVASQPDTLLGLTLLESEYVPNTFSTQLYVGMLADFSHYWIADSLSFYVQRLVELYATTNQVGFIGRAESDGMPVLAEAFTRVKLA